jgi:hypothetical protein
MRGINWRIGRVAAVVSIAGVGIWVPAIGSSAAHAADSSSQKPHVISWTPPHSAQARTAARVAALKAPAATQIPLWSSNFHDQLSGHDFNDTLVGANPSTSNVTTKVPVKVIPLVFQFTGGGTYDPTQPSACSTDTATKKVKASPIFKNHDYVFGGTDVGKGQYNDEFRRAEFSSSALPKWHTKLTPKYLKPVTLTVPAGDWSEFTVSGSCKLGEVNINWLDGMLQSTITSLISAGVTTATFPLFLTNNVVSYVGFPANCCILGYHSFFNNPNNNLPQTYGISDYENSGAFPPSALGDVSVLSHEVGEWLDDPFVNNLTDAWGNIGQVNGCQGNLEVGDPLSGTLIPVPMGKNTFHVQELAFVGWFYHWNPSGGLNGWYSLNGTFLSPAAPCP